jgi:hypothetical protein
MAITHKRHKEGNPRVEKYEAFSDLVIMAFLVLTYRSRPFVKVKLYTLMAVSGNTLSSVIFR